MMPHLENHMVGQGVAGVAENHAAPLPHHPTPYRGGGGGVAGGSLSAVVGQIEGEARVDLARIATALNRPIRSFTWRDGMARVVLADGRIAAGLGDTKADAWARLVSVLGVG